MTKKSPPIAKILLVVIGEDDSDETGTVRWRRNTKRGNIGDITG
jgi:hypothetical protein